MRVGGGGNLVRVIGVGKKGVSEGAATCYSTAARSCLRA
jgi:hypothetical protein